jgi:hypothetical protein
MMMNYYSIVEKAFYLVIIEERVIVYAVAHWSAVLY